jgi:energy-coupling factor transport system permease protein
VFIGSTQPSELAASMNKIGIPYGFSYSFALALRYIPDTVSSFIDISRCQQARGIEMSNKESLLKRVRAAAALVLPLILGSVEQIEVITNAMELRKFGTQKRRTWIMSRPFRAGDYLTIAIGIGMMAFVVAYNVINGSRFWNPFT